MFGEGILRGFRNFLYKALGLGKLRAEIQADLAEIRSLLSGGSSEAMALGGGNPYSHLLASTLDERLNFYFRWRLPIQFSDAGSTLIHTNDGHRLYVDTKEPFITLHLLEHGEWEAPVRRELARELKPGATLIDVGANIGLHTLYATTLVGSAGRVISLEPHPITREILRKNLEVNGLLERVTISPLVASDKDDMVVSFEYFPQHPAMSGVKVADEIVKQFSGTVESIELETTTIDTLVDRLDLVPDLVKIDVEGYEYAVLQG